MAEEAETKIQETSEDEVEPKTKSVGKVEIKGSKIEEKKEEEEDEKGEDSEEEKESKSIKDDEEESEEEEEKDASMNDTLDSSKDKSKTDNDTSKTAPASTPSERSSKRERKKVERFEQKEKKNECQAQGKGVALGEIPYIESMIMKFQADDLKGLHRLAYGRPGASTEVKKNLKRFNGLPFTKEDKPFKSKLTSVEKMFLNELKKICTVLGLDKGGQKSMLVERVVDFLLEPQDFGKKVKAKKKKKESTSKGGKKGTKAKSAKKATASEATESEEEESEDEQEESGDEEEDSEEEEEEEEEEKPAKKKTPAKKTPAKPQKTPKASSAKKNGKAPKRKASSSEEDSDEDDDVPLVKKAKKIPTDDDIKIFIKKFLTTADLEKVTMKKVRQKVYDNYPSHDLSHKKDFITDTVKSILS